ncbi:hypothetical protein QUA25_17615 [Microcoleus sp. Pol17C6]
MCDRSVNMRRGFADRTPIEAISRHLGQYLGIWENFENMVIYPL